MATQVMAIRPVHGAMLMLPPSLVGLQLPALVASDVSIALIPHVRYREGPLGVISRSFRVPFANGVVMAMER